MVIAVRTERGPQCLEVVKAAGTDAERARLRHEAQMLRRAAHPGVVDVVDETESVLHLRHCGTPLARLGPLPPDNVAAVVRSVAETVAALHDQGIAHTRITADHIVVGERGRPRLCGFGQATDATEQHRADDVAALGHLLDQLLDAGGDAPWDPMHRGVRHAGRRRRATAAFRAAAAAARRDDPGQRPTARQLATALHDAFPDLTLPAPPDSGEGAAPRHFAPTDSGWTDDDLSFLNIDDETEEEWVTGQTPVVGGRAEVVVPSGREWEDFVRDFGQDSGDDDDLPPDREDDVPAPSAADAPPPEPPATGIVAAAAPPVITIRPGLTEGERPRGDRALLVAVAAAVLVIGAVAGAVIAQAVRPFGSAEVASSPATVAPPTTSDDTQDDDADPPTTTPPGCPVPDVAGPDVNGDDCPDPVQLDDRVATVGTVRVELGRPGDAVVVADSDCDGVATPAVLRPDTGEVFLFSTWELDEPTEVGPATVVPGASEIRTTGGACPEVVVTGAEGLREVVAGADG